MTERPLLIQTHWTDFESCPRLLEDPCVSLALRARDRFDRVVLVSGDCPENRVVEEYAREIGVECYAGDLFDVADRFEQCMKTLGFQQAARVLSYWFMVDFGLVSCCFDTLEQESADIVSLPRDFDLKFGADVFSLAFLEKFRDMIGDFEEPLRGELSFRPWALAELHPERFRVADCESVPVFDDRRFREIAETCNEYYPERFLTAQSPLDAYEKAAALLQGEYRIADIACGCGDGSRLLSERFPQVIGIDYSAQQIAENRRRFKGVENLQFEAGDATDEGLFENGSLDAVVSIHTMEHLPDDERFLANCREWLRPDGRLILEVPLLMAYPFKGIGRPLGEKHFREYHLDPLLQLCSHSFTVERTYGVSRGLYLAPEQARNAVLLVLRRSDL